MRNMMAYLVLLLICAIFVPFTAFFCEAILHIRDGEMVAFICLLVFATLLIIGLVFFRPSKDVEKKTSNGNSDPGDEKELEVLEKMWGQLDRLEERVANLETILMNRVR